MAIKWGLFGTHNRQQEQGSALVTYGEVARMAYNLYEQRGRSDGHDLEDWLRAEAMVKARRIK